MNYDLFLFPVYLIFYGLLFTFLYFNIVAQNNFSKSNEIIIENSSKSCVQPVQTLKQVNNDDLIKCSQGGNYIYSIPQDSLKFKVSTKSESAGHFTTICNFYCPGNLSTTGKCLTPSGTIPVSYQNCIKLLEPPPGCSNSSNPVAFDTSNNEILYAVRSTSTSIC